MLVAKHDTYQNHLGNLQVKNSLPRAAPQGHSGKIRVGARNACFPPALWVAPIELIMLNPDLKKSQ